MSKILWILATILMLGLNYKDVSATEIALEQTRIPEGNFSILLYNPSRSETPLRNEKAGYTITTYSYQSYFKGFDVSYSASYSDWTFAKQYEIGKYGIEFSDINEDLEYTVSTAKYFIEKQLKASVTIVRNNTIKYLNYPGREAVFEFYSDKMKYVMRLRTFRVGYKEYSQQVVYPQQFERYVQPQKFLDSFKVDSTKLKTTNTK